MTEPRGAHLLDAALSVLAEQGLGAVSMRSVAARADVSVAQVQYYFRTKAELVSGAYDRAHEQFLDSLLPILPGPPSADRLRRVVLLWLPLDAERERRARVWLAFSAAATNAPELAERACALDGELRRWFARQLRALAPDGLRIGTDPRSLAAELFALIDGLTSQLLVMDPAARDELAGRVLDGWFSLHLPTSPLRTQETHA